VLASLASARTAALGAAGADPVQALNGGYQWAFLVGAVFTAVAGLLSGMLLRTRLQPGAQALAAH